MKKIIALTFTGVLFLTIVKSQSISEKQARDILDKAWSCLKTNDTVSFINLWSLNDSVSIHQKRPHSRREVAADFDMVKQWLDTALLRNQDISRVDVDEQKLLGTDVKYWIQAWFKYDKSYYKAFGFYIAYRNNKWIVRDSPSTSSLRK